MSSKAEYLSRPELLQQLPVFFQPWWLDAVSRNWDIALAEDKGRIEGVWPYARDSKFGFKLIRNPQLTPYLGPFFFYPEQLSTAEKVLFEQRVFENLWQQLPRWDSFDLEATTAFENAALFLQKEFTTTGKITYELRLDQTEEQLWSALHSNHRNLIRQAEQCHEIVEGTDYLPGLAALHKATFQRKGKPYPFKPSMITRLVNESYKHNAGSIFAARDEQQRITASIFTVWDQEKMYLLLSTVNPEQAHPGAVRLLIFHALKAAKQKGLRIFDFEGSMDPGIAAFFRRFGGQQKTYLCATKNKSVLWKIKKTILD